MSTKPTREIEVELDNGRIVVQEQDDAYRVSDRVRIIDDNKRNMRVR